MDEARPASIVKTRARVVASDYLCGVLPIPTNPDYESDPPILLN